MSMHGGTLALEFVVAMATVAAHKSPTDELVMVNETHALTE